MSDNVTDLIQSMVNDKPNEAQRAFSDEVMSRIADRLEDIKQDVSNRIFNNNSNEGGE
jgi:hypothetical protein